MRLTVSPMLRRRRRKRGRDDGFLYDYINAEPVEVKGGFDYLLLQALILDSALIFSFQAALF